VPLSPPLGRCLLRNSDFTCKMCSAQTLARPSGRLWRGPLRKAFAFLRCILARPAVLITSWFVCDPCSFHHDSSAKLVLAYLTLLYMLHCICHVRFQPKAALPLRNLCRNPPGKVLASDALAMFIVRHLVSGNSIPNFANVRFGFLFENFASRHTTQSPWNQAYTA